MRQTSLKTKPEGKRNTATAVILDSTSEVVTYTDGALSKDVVDGITKGSQALVRRSDAVLSRIELIEQLADAAPQSERCVTGGLADVPAYLQGSPVAMRRRTRREDKAPVTIVVDATTSWGISSEIIERRGVAVLALLRKLEAEGHAVTLWVGFAGMPRETTLIAAPIQTQPLDLARACWILSDSDYQRQAMFTACRKAGGTSATISWPWNMGSAWAEDTELQARAWGEALRVDPSEVQVVPPVYLSEADKFSSDEAAAEWVNTAYAQAVQRSL